MSISKKWLKILSLFIRKIKDNKQHTIDEGKKVNDQLKEF